MILSKMMVKMYTRFVEVLLWLSLLAFILAGWEYGGAAGREVVGALVGFLAWAFFATTFFGAFLLVADIQKCVDKIASAK